jgi:hypothetical protein
VRALRRRVRRIAAATTTTAAAAGKQTKQHRQARIFSCFFHTVNFTQKDRAELFWVLRFEGALKY